MLHLSKIVIFHGYVSHNQIFIQTESLGDFQWIRYSTVCALLGLDSSSCRIKIALPPGCFAWDTATRITPYENQGDQAIYLYCQNISHFSGGFSES